MARGMGVRWNELVHEGIGLKKVLPSALADELKRILGNKPAIYESYVFRRSVNLMATAGVANRVETSREADGITMELYFGEQTRQRIRFSDREEDLVMGMVNQGEDETVIVVRSVRGRWTRTEMEPGESDEVRLRTVYRIRIFREMEYSVPIENQEDMD